MVNWERGYKRGGGLVVVNRGLIKIVMRYVFNGGWPIGGLTWDGSQGCNDNRNEGSLKNLI